MENYYFFFLALLQNTKNIEKIVNPFLLPPLYELSEQKCALRPSSDAGFNILVTLQVSANKTYMLSNFCDLIECFNLVVLIYTFVSTLECV